MDILLIFKYSRFKLQSSILSEFRPTPKLSNSATTLFFNA